MDPPDRVGRYVVLGELSGGARASELFLAHHEEEPADALVCIKRVHPNYSDDPRFSERFEQELQLAKTLRHRNIVEVSDYGEDDGHFFVMEYVGPNLDTILRSGRLSPDLVTYIGIELCRVLAFLHHSDRLLGRGPLIHGDVTPDNVLIGRRDGAVKLSDFGIAKALGKTGQEVLTRARGKPSYMSPEQLQGAKVSTRTDLFSLGLVLFRALVGKHPYAGGKPPGPEPTLPEWIVEQTLANRRSSVEEEAPYAEKALRDAIEGLLQPVESRIPTAEDAFHILRQVEPLDGHTQLMSWLAELEEDE